MANEPTGDVTPSTDEGKETLLENQETQTDEGGDAAPASTTEDVAKQEADSFYAEQLKALEEENARLRTEAEERERQIEIKDRAIQAAKKKPQEKVGDRETIKQEVLSEVKGELAREQATQFIESIAKDPTEQKLFLHHYVNSPNKTGNVREDVLKAIATANAPRILELLGRDRAEDEAEDRSISSMRGEGVRSESPRVKSALRKEVEKLLPKDALKHLNKYVPR